MRGGKNLIPITLADIKTLNQSGTWSGNTYTLFDIDFNVNTDSAGYVVSITANGTHAGGDVGMVLGEVTFKAGVSYKISSNTVGSSNNTYRIWTVSNSAYPVGHRFTTDSTLLGENVASEARATETCKIQYQIMAGYTANNMTVYPMIYYADIDDTTYEPYKGSITITIALGQTVYGGTLDVKTGVLTITWVKFTDTWGNGTAAADLGDCIRKNFDFSSSGLSKNESQAISNCAKYLNEYATDTPHFTINASNHSIMYLILPETTDSDFVVELCYELATPIPIQLSPAQLMMLKGYNSLSTDGGDVITITAYAINEEVGA